MKDDVRWAVLARKLLTAGCTQEELAELERLRTDDPDLAEWLASRGSITNEATAEALNTVDADRALADIRQTLRLDEPRSTPRRREIRAVRAPGSGVAPAWPGGVGNGGSVVADPYYVGRATWRGAAIAASVVAALGVGLTVGVWRRQAEARAVTGREYATAAGRRLSTTLGDGTRLMLAPASRVRVAANYGRGTGPREVALEGEAYFVVAHDAAHPFTVRAHGAVARDVGTAFDVRAYPADVETQIAVAEGAVTVSAVAGCRTSKPCGVEAKGGDVASVSPGGVAVAHGVDVTALTGWTEGRLVFDGTRMAEVIAEVSRWYGVDVTLKDGSLGDKRVMATFTGQPVREVLAVLAASAGARVERRGAGYLLVAMNHIKGDP